MNEEKAKKSAKVKERWIISIYFVARFHCQFSLFVRFRFITAAPRFFVEPVWKMRKTVGLENATKEKNVKKKMEMIGASIQFSLVLPHTFNTVNSNVDCRVLKSY